MNTRNKVLFLATGGVILLILTFGMLTLFGHTSSSSTKNLASAEIIFSVGDTDQLGLRLNNKAVTVTDLDATYPLAAGTYQLTAKKPGYRDFSTSFTVKAQQSVVINVSMDRTEPIPKITDVSQITGNGTDSLSGWTINNVQYFDDGSWAFLDIRGDTGVGAFVITNYNITAKAWVNIAGPNSIFPADSVQNLPDDITTFLQQNNYITDRID